MPPVTLPQQLCFQASMQELGAMCDLDSNSGLVDVEEMINIITAYSS